MTFDEHMHEQARLYLSEKLDEHGKNVPAAAKAAGRHRTDFYALLKKYGVPLKPRAHTGNAEWLAMSARANL